MGGEIDPDAILEKTEQFAASIFSEIVSRFSENGETYLLYLSDGITEIRDQISDTIDGNLDLKHMGIHYKGPNDEPRLQYLSEDEEISVIWKKLSSSFKDDNHIAKILQLPSYQGKTDISISVGETEGSATINIPSNIAYILKKLINDITGFSDDNECDSNLNEIMNNLELKNWLNTIGDKLVQITNDQRFRKPIITLKSLLLSLHLTLYLLKDDRSNSCSYYCYYSRIADEKYILGSLAGRFERDLDQEELKKIQYFCKGLLSYITYWEGIANYEKSDDYKILKPLENEELKNKVKKMFEDFFNELIFFDPNDPKNPGKTIIKDSLTFEGAFRSTRTSHKTGKTQHILVVRLRVKSQEAFRFLYCNGAKNYMKIENHLETLVKKEGHADRVRLDLAIDYSIPWFDTLNTETTSLLNIEDIIPQNKIAQEGIIYKFYKKYRDIS